MTNLKVFEIHYIFLSLYSMIILNDIFLIDIVLFIGIKLDTKKIYLIINHSILNYKIEYILNNYKIYNFLIRKEV